MKIHWNRRGAVLGAVAGGIIGELVARSYVPDYQPKPENPALPQAVQNQIVVDNAFGPTRVRTERNNYAFSGSLTGLVLGGFVFGDYLFKQR